MTASPVIGGWRASGSAAAPWVEAALVAAGLWAIVAIRWSAARAGIDALIVGGAFGLALLALGILVSGRQRPRIGRGALLVGLAFGLVLVIAAALAPPLAGVMRVPGLGRPAVAFLPWALVTIIVASAEEAILRGVLFDRVSRAAGTTVALATTTVVFALLHVPLYGWSVVPLDLAVGLALGGLRVLTRSFAAPAVAHAFADLATWWL